MQVYKVALSMYPPIPPAYVGDGGMSYSVFCVFHRKKNLIEKNNTFDYSIFYHYLLSKGENVACRKHKTTF